MDSIGVHWINLKPHLLPCIVKETDQVVTKHRDLINKSKNGDQQAKMNLEFQNVSLRARIEDYDNYYANHFQDFRTPFFEKQKFRLRRLLAESMAVSSDGYDAEEMEIVSDEQLEAMKRETIKNDPLYVNYNERKKLTGTNTHTMNSQYDREKSRDEIKSRIQQSINRLSSPPRRYQIAEQEIRANKNRDDDLVFSIKMSKTDYEEYMRQRGQA